MGSNPISNTQPGVKTIMHFCSKGYSLIDGEWRSVTHKFSNGLDFILKPLFFACEDWLLEQVMTLNGKIATLLFEEKNWRTFDRCSD